MSVPTLLIAEARGTTKRVARTFSLACRLLPKRLRDDVYLLYLVFRTLDDLVDEGQPEAAERIAAVEAWCSGAVAPATLETTILYDLGRRHPIPADALRDFCAGMRHDLAGAPLLTEDDVDRYCYQVAGTVGLVMAHMLGTDDPDTAHPAAVALGMAMQRTNILRDVDEDIGNGRAYLAADTVRRLGGSLAPGAREPVMRDQIARADALYERAAPGSASSATAAGQSPRRPSCIARSCARSSARATAGAPAARSSPLAQAAARGARRGARALGLRLRRVMLLRTSPARLLLGALVGAQLAYPRLPDRHRTTATRGIVGLMLAASAAEAFDARGARRGLAPLVAAGAIGFGVELAGVTTGRPFGHYSYSAKLGPAWAACRCWRRRPGR